MEDRVIGVVQTMEDRVIAVVQTMQTFSFNVHLLPLKFLICTFISESVSISIGQVLDFIFFK